ncbi:hypothetical protein N310_12229, partial [Acanthisitta chloris]
WYSVIDLKDAFWACPLREDCRDYFAFEWEDPDTHPKGSLNLRISALEQILKGYELGDEVTLIQYVDDLLLASKSEEAVRQDSIKLLNFLSLQGLKVSKSKLQFAEKEVKYLGHRLNRGTKKLDPERVNGILSLQAPKTKRQVRQLLGLFGYCRQWIEDYSTKVKFLYTKLTIDGLLKWSDEDDKKLETLKTDLVNAPVLSLPDVKKPFNLFISTSE